MAVPGGTELLFEADVQRAKGNVGRGGCLNLEVASLQHEEVECSLRKLRREYKNATVEKAFNVARSMSTDAAVLFAARHLVSADRG